MKKEWNRIQDIKKRIKWVRRETKKKKEKELSYLQQNKLLSFADFYDVFLMMCALYWA